MTVDDEHGGIVGLDASLDLARGKPSTSIVDPDGLLETNPADRRVGWTWLTLDRRIGNEGHVEKSSCQTGVGKRKDREENGHGGKREKAAVRDERAERRVVEKKILVARVMSSSD